MHLAYYHINSNRFAPHQNIMQNHELANYYKHDSSINHFCWNGRGNHEMRLVRSDDETVIAYLHMCCDISWSRYSHSNLVFTKQKKKYYRGFSMKVLNGFLESKSWLKVLILERMVQNLWIFKRTKWWHSLYAPFHLYGAIVRVELGLYML